VTRRGESGFTLVEMLVALFLFSLIAMTATMLTASASRALILSDTALAGIDGFERTRALLAADLGQAARRPSLAADGRPMPAFTLTPDGFVLVRGGLTGVLPTVEKLAWGFDGTRWLRQPFPTVDGSAPGPATVLMTGVKAARIRVLTPAGWQSSWTPTRPEQLPLALELTLVRSDNRPVTMIMQVSG